MATVPRIVLRSVGYVEMVTRNSPDISGWRYGAANDLDTAFGGTTPMFTVDRDGAYRSPTIRQKRWGFSQSEYRGLTRVVYDPEDFWVAAGTLPHDTETAYMTLEERNAAGAFRPPGPILVVPVPGFFSTPRPVLNIAGTAPAVGAAVCSSAPPAGAMHVVFPQFTDFMSFNNTSANSIFLSFGEGMAEVEVATNTTMQLFQNVVSEIYIRASVASLFSAAFTVVNSGLP